MNRNFSNNSGRGADFDYATQTRPVARRTTSTATREELDVGKSWITIMGCFLAVVVVVSEVAKHAHLFS